jgi:hypothetical protein
MNPVIARQLGNRPVASERRQRHLRLEPRTVLLRWTPIVRQPEPLLKV